METFGQRVVAGGCDGEATVALFHCQGFEEDVGVLPAVGVANAVESGSILDFVVVPPTASWLVIAGGLRR